MFLRIAIRKGGLGVIRGTNKRIIEINGEDDSCFERIVLFLRPEQENGSMEKMVKMAEDYAGGLFRSGAPVSLLSERKRRWPLKRIVSAVLGALLAGGAIALYFVLF